MLTDANVRLPGAIQILDYTTTRAGTHLLYSYKSTNADANARLPGAIQILDYTTTRAGTAGSSKPNVWSFGACCPVDCWTLIALVRENGGTSVYIDGCKAGSIPKHFSLALTAVGASARNPQQEYFCGAVRLVRVLDRAATPDQLLSSVRCGLAGLSLSLLLFFSLSLSRSLALSLYLSLLHARARARAHTHTHTHTHTNTHTQFDGSAVLSCVGMYCKMIVLLVQR
jgi:hypothetical protein